MKSHDKKQDVLSFLVESRDSIVIYAGNQNQYIYIKRSPNSHHAQAGLKCGFRLARDINHGTGQKLSVVSGIKRRGND